VVVVGAGVSGICAVARLKHHFGEGALDITVYERDVDVAGTWLQNHYPGAECDVPSHFYCFSFAPNPGFTRYYAPQREIHAYLSHVARAHGVYDTVRFGVEFLGARWDEGAKGYWVTTCDAGSVGAPRPVETTSFANFVILSSAALNRPAVPEFPGARDFKGPIFHTARWDDTFDATGKRVAVVGTGASSIQVVPALGPKAAALTVFQRTPPWILPRGNYSYPAWVQWVFLHIPLLLWLYRIFLWLQRDVIFFPAFKRGSLGERYVKSMCTSHLAASVPDPALRARLTPDYPPGCKRLLISDDYLTTVARPTTTLVTSAIARIDATGIVTADGVHHDADAIVMATGFQVTSFLSHLALTGRSGVPLSVKWSDPNAIEAYRGTQLSGMPNMFVLMGPNTALGHSSMIFIIETQVEYMCAILARMFRVGAVTVDVLPRAQRDYNTWLQRDLAGTVWGGSCASWYKLPDTGKIVTLWPHSTAHFWWTLRQPDFGDMALAT